MPKRRATILIGAVAILPLLVTVMVPLPTGVLDGTIPANWSGALGVHATT